LYTTYSLFDLQDCSPPAEASTHQSALKLPRDLISFPSLLILTSILQEIFS
jgi:hypothetical protein